jgi:hypothetical protein
VVELSHDSRPIIGRGPPLGASFIALALLSIALMITDQRYPQIQRFRTAHGRRVPGPERRRPAISCVALGR